MTVMDARAIPRAPKGAAPTYMRLRHNRIAKSFFLVVVFPLIAVVFYLYAIAANQYASTLGFTVRSDEMNSAAGLLGGLSILTQASSSDTDVLYEFIQSQSMVERIAKRLDLRHIYSKPTFDPFFALKSDSDIEDLVAYWRRMVTVSYASGNGLIEVQVRAFDPQDAQQIGQAIVEESSAMINDLSAIARADGTRSAREELDVAVQRLKAARQALTLFRSKTRIVDPSADIQGQMGLLNSLDAQLANAFIDLNMLMETSSGDDPRVTQARRRIDVIEKLVEQERQKFGMGDSDSSVLPGDNDYPTLMGEFERLNVDVEYTSKAYLVAMAALDAARVEAQHKSRYLATYAEPSLPESAQFPQRAVLSLVTAMFLAMIWSIGVLIFYSLRDRR